MTLDIFIVTKLSGGRFFNLVESIRANVSQDTLARTNIQVCYTGLEPDGEVRIRESLDGVGVGCYVVTMPYNFAACNNALARVSIGDYILCLNDDVELKSDSITYALGLMDADSTLGAVGLKLIYGDKQHIVQHFGQRLYIRQSDNGFVGVNHLLGNSPDIRPPDMLVQGVTGAWLMMRRADYQRIGGFDERYRYCFEDVVLCWALRGLGRRIVCVGRHSALHYESSTRGPGNVCREDVERMRAYYDEHRDEILRDRAIYPYTIVEV